MILMDMMDMTDMVDMTDMCAYYRAELNSAFITDLSISGPHICAALPVTSN